MPSLISSLFAGACLFGAAFPTINAHFVPGPPGHPHSPTPPSHTTPSSKYRTVVTTDMEQDDLAALIRYMLYTNDFDTEGIIYSASEWHWAGDGKGTEFFMPGREYKTPQTSWRWTGTQTIQEIVIPAYAQVYSNLVVHDPAYPTPEELLSLVKVGNIDFEGEMSYDTDGSNLIKQLLLNDDPRPLYLQVWGGFNTVGRALKSIEDQYSNTSEWSTIKATVSQKAVILGSGFQDNVYAKYIAPTWPAVRVEDLEQGYATWAYNCNVNGTGNQRGKPDNGIYFSGEWIHANIETGPLGKLYRSWLDGQAMPGDPEDGWGNATLAAIVQPHCAALEPYAFLSEGDIVVFLPLMPTGLDDPSNPALGGWGGRAAQNSTVPDLWITVANETGPNGTEIPNYTIDRWVPAVQNDFAARMQWTLVGEYSEGNHAPWVSILNGASVQAQAGATVRLAGAVGDPDGDAVATSWWQYREEGSYNGTVSVVAAQGNLNLATVVVPEDAEVGQTISVIFQGTDNGDFPLTRYDRVVIEVVAGRKGGWPWS